MHFDFVRSLIEKKSLGPHFSLPRIYFSIHTFCCVPYLVTLPSQITVNMLTFAQLEDLLQQLNLLIVSTQ
jgi:hypothetical protein